jgi:hypothetical protein
VQSSTACETSTGRAIASQEKQGPRADVCRTQPEARRPATDEEVSEAMGENLDGFYALIDQLHGLTIGLFET